MVERFSREHRRFLIVDEIVGPAIVNFWLNAAIAWYVSRKLLSVPLWGSRGIAADTLVTAFVLPVLTALIAAGLIPMRVRRNALLPIPADRLRPSPWTRRSSVVRGVLLGLAAVVVVGLPVVGAFVLAGAPSLPRPSFVWFKASFAAGVGILVTPPLGWWSLMDASRAAR